MKLIPVSSSLVKSFSIISLLSAVGFFSSCAATPAVYSFPLTVLQGTADIRVSTAYPKKESSESLSGEEWSEQSKPFVNFWKPDDEPVLKRKLPSEDTYFSRVPLRQKPAKRKETVPQAWKPPAAIPKQLAKGEMLQLNPPPDTAVIVLVENTQEDILTLASTGYVFSLKKGESRMLTFK